MQNDSKSASNDRQFIRRTPSLFVKNWIVIIGSLVLIAYCISTVFPPGMGRMRETARRAKCASNLMQFGKGMILYANQFNGSYPSDYATLARFVKFPEQCYICPSIDGNNYNDPAHSDVIADSVPPSSNYIYLASGLTSEVTADCVFMIEPLTNHREQGANVLMADGMVTFVNIEMAQAIIRQIDNGTRPVRLKP